MRICLLASTYHPIIGGAESYALKLATGLVDAGHDVLVFTDGARDNLPVNEIHRGVVIRRAVAYRNMLDDPSKVTFEQMSLSLLPELEAALEHWGKQPDVLHANSHEMALLASMARVATGAPVVGSFHEQAPEKGALGRSRCEFIYRHLGLSAVIAGSLFYRQKALDHDCPPDDLYLVYHGVAAPLQPSDNAPVRERLGVKADAPLVVCGARLSPRKGIDILVDAFAQVVRAIPDARLVIAGTTNSADGTYARILHDKVGAPDLAGRAQIDGSFTHDDMPALFAAADVVVQPSYSEGLGLSLLEAMAMGTAVIGSDIPGIREILSEPNVGRMVAAGDVNAWATEIVDALTNNSARESLAKRGAAFVQERFSLERMIAETVDVYDRVCLAVPS